LTICSINVDVVTQITRYGGRYAGEDHGEDPIMTAFGEGAPCWADVMLPDLAAGRRFYGELFGWTFEDQGESAGNYTIARRDGRAAAALMPKADPAMPTAWGVYFATADAARTAARITDAGGHILFGPDPVGAAGVMVGALDPGGSAFSLWQPGARPGFDVVGEPGAYCWTENHTLDAAAVDPFYEAVFGYRTRQIGDGVGFDYKVWSLPEAPEDPVAGRMRRGGDLPPDAPSAYQTYFVVADCDTAADTVRRLGGTVFHEPHDSPFGRTAVVTDDQGAAFAVIDVLRTSGGA
jgi:predicted enzyme related to lactoylglutathione lyase